MDGPASNSSRKMHVWSGLGPCIQVDYSAETPMQTHKDTQKMIMSMI